MRIGVLGGTFDPIHVAHLAGAEDVAWLLGLDKVLFVPNRIPPHKETASVSQVNDRVAMVQLAIADNPLFELDLLELERSGPSYTLDTLRQLRDRCASGVELYFLVGCDALNDLHTWHEPDQLLEEFTLVVMERPAHSPVDWNRVECRFPRVRDQIKLLDIAALEISASDIRQRIAEGRPVRYFLPPAVARYIQEHRLYGANGRVT